MISRQLQAGAGAHNECRSITTLFPYAVNQEQSGDAWLFDLSLHALSAMDEHGCLILDLVESFFIASLSEESPMSLKQTAILASPYLCWRWMYDKKDLIQLLAAAASVVPYTDDIGQSMANTLLQIASGHNSQLHIPSSMWVWLGRCPLLPPACIACRNASVQGVVKMVRALGDIQILKSYLFHVWSEWNYFGNWGPTTFYHSGLPEMCTSIREDFGGSEMGHHWEDLQWLNNVLGQLELGLDHHPIESKIPEMKEQYGELKKVLLEVDREAGGELVDILIHESPMLVILLSLTLI